MVVIVIGAAVFGLAYAFTHRGGRRVTMPDAWQQGARPAPLTASTPPSAVRAGSQRAAALQLARFEGRLLLRSEAFIVGVVMSIAVIVLFGVVWADDNIGAQNSWRFSLALLPVFTLPFAGMTLIAVNVAVLRSRRDGAEELFESLPADDSSRAAAHLGSMWTALIVQLLLVGAYIATGRLLNHHFGAIDAASVGDVAVSFVLVSCAAALAVTLARWFPHPLAAVAALVALAIVGTIIGGIGGRHWSLSRQLSIWPRHPDHDLLFAIRPSWWHALYLLALGVLVAVAAISKDRRSRGVALAIAAAALVAAVAGTVQTRPMTKSDAERIAAMVADPVAHSTCRDLDGLNLCAYHDYVEILDDWTDQLAAPFAAVAPQQRKAGFTVVWRERRLDRLDPTVKERIDASALEASWVADDSTWNGVTVSGPESAGVNRLALGLWSSELPLAPGIDGMPCAVGGQARGVVALWIAAQGKSTKAARDFVGGSWSGINNPDNQPDLPPSWIGGYVWVLDGTPPVLWSAADIDAAQAMVSLDPDRVRELLWSDWPRWVDRATPTDELLVELGLPPTGATASAPTGTVTCQ